MVWRMAVTGLSRHMISGMMGRAAKPDCQRMVMVMVRDFMGISGNLL